MTTITLTNLGIGLGLIAYICSRQLSWRAVDPARMWKLPLVLGAVGIVALAKQTTTIHPADVLILTLSAAFALASGVVMGRIAQFRPAPADPGMIESRTGRLGVGIWIGLVAVRVTLDVVGHRMGSAVAVSTGSILLFLALNRAASAFVISARQPRGATRVAGR
jgi:hypothetical protein